MARAHALQAVFVTFKIQYSTHKTNVIKWVNDVSAAVRVEIDTVHTCTAVCTFTYIPRYCHSQQGVRQGGEGMSLFPRHKIQIF